MQHRPNTKAGRRHVNPAGAVVDRQEANLDETAAQDKKKEKLAPDRIRVSAEEGLTVQQQRMFKRWNERGKGSVLNDNFQRKRHLAMGGKVLQPCGEKRQNCRPCKD
mmetsp:Transcript_17949/g.30962  ORF Transcript_17949/g.30962 Transcript_17949/m.30962 type:complete len:107 (+) Transcript_17949:187-507(+)